MERETEIIQRKRDTEIKRKEWRETDRWTDRHTQDREVHCERETERKWGRQRRRRKRREVQRPRRETRRHKEKLAKEGKYRERAGRQEGEPGGGSHGPEPLPRPGQARSSWWPLPSHG